MAVSGGYGRVRRITGHVKVGRYLGRRLVVYVYVLTSRFPSTIKDGLQCSGIVQGFVGTFMARFSVLGGHCIYLVVCFYVGGSF